MANFNQFISNYWELFLSILILMTECLHGMMTNSLYDYKTMTNESSTIICRSSSLSFWDTDYTKYGMRVLYMSGFLLCGLISRSFHQFGFSYSTVVSNLSRLFPYITICSIFSQGLRALFVLFGLIFRPLSNVTGATVKEAQYDNFTVLFRFNYSLSSPQAYAILVSKYRLDPFQFGFNKFTTQRGLGGQCFNHKLSWLSTTAPVIKSEEPTSRSLDLFESHFSELHPVSGFFTFYAIVFVVIALVGLFYFLYMNRSYFDRQDNLHQNSNQNLRQNVHQPEQNQQAPQHQAQAQQPQNLTHRNPRADIPS